MASSLQVYIEYLNKGLDDVQAGLKTVDTGLRNIGKQAEALDAKLRKVDQTLAGWQRTASLLAGAGVGGLALVVREGIKVHGTFERIRLSLEVMLKSKEKADAMMKDIVKFAATTPFSLRDLSEAVNQMKSFRVETENVLPYLRIIGEAAATMKVPIEQAVRAMLQLKGGMFDTRQLVPIGITRELLKQYGVKFDTSGQLASDYEEAFQAALKAMDENFGGMFKRVNLTIEGLLNNLGDTIDRVWDFIGSTLSEKFKATVKRINDTLSQLVDSDRLRRAIMGSMDVLLGEVGPKIDGVLTYLEKLIGYLERNPEALANAMRTFVEVLKTLLAAVMALTAARGIIALITPLLTLGAILSGGVGAAVAGAVGVVGLIGMFIAFRKALDNFGFAISPASEKVRQLNRDLSDLATKENDAKEKMEKAAEAAHEQAGKLEGLKKPSDEATTAQDGLTQSQQAFIDAKDNYIAAIDAQITKLQELRDALNFSMTPEGILAELKAQAERGYPGGLPLTAAQWKVKQDHATHAEIGHAAWEAWQAKGMGSFQELLAELGVEAPGPLEITGMGGPNPIWERLGYAYTRRILRSQGIKTKHQQTGIDLEIQSLRQQKEYPALIEEHVPAVSPGFIEGLGLPDAAAAGEGLSQKYDELGEFSDLLTKAERDVLKLTEERRAASKSIVKSLNQQLDQMERLEQLTGKDQTAEMARLMADAYEELYTKQLDRFVDSDLWERMGIAHEGVVAAEKALEEATLDAARERQADVRRNLDIARAQAAGDERYAKALQGEGLIENAQQAMDDLANAADAPEDELLNLQTAALAAVTALYTFASSLAGLDEQMAAALRAAAASLQSQLEAAMGGGIQARAENMPATDAQGNPLRDPTTGKITRAGHEYLDGGWGGGGNGGGYVPGDFNSLLGGCPPGG